MNETGGLKNKVFGLVLFTLFAWLIISVAINTGEEYGRDTQEIGNGSLSGIKFQESIENVSSTSEEYRESFESGQIDDVDDVTGIFSTAKKVVNFITAPFNLLANILEATFKIPTIATNVFLGLLSLSIIFGIWRLIRAGD